MASESIAVTQSPFGLEEELLITPGMTPEIDQHSNSEARALSAYI